MATVAPSSQPANDLKPNIYAEFLPRLGRISVVIHLPTPSTHKTKVLTSNDASRLIVYHEGITTELRLPTKVHSPVGEHLPEEVQPGLSKLSWRLVPKMKETASEGFANGIVPWSANQLMPGLSVACRDCGGRIVAGDRIKVFKDLPSENWAEMMDLWHCHKPSEGHLSGVPNSTTGQDKDGQEKASEADLASRAYGANSAILAQEGTGFVDSMTMLFVEQDCFCLILPSGIVPSATPFPIKDMSKFPTIDIICPNCLTILGRFDKRKHGVSLFKWKIDMVEHVGIEDLLTSEFKNLPNAPTLSHCLSAALVEMQAQTGSARFVLQGDKEVITVWVLNPSIRFSCFSKQGILAMKLLYQPGALDEDEINLPDEVIKDIKAILEAGNAYLPPDEKTKVLHGQRDVWTISMLERWDPCSEVKIYSASKSEANKENAQQQPMGDDLILI